MDLCHSLDAVMHPSFSKIWGHMAFDGIQTNHHPFSNLLIRVASYDQVEHLQFAFT